MNGRVLSLLGKSRSPQRVAAGALLAGALVFATGCDVIGSGPGPIPTVVPKPTPQPERATVQVKRGTIVDAIKVLGRVVASQEADLSFRNSGRIREVYVQPGDLVQPGQVLAELDQRALPWQLAKARNTVQQAQLRLDSALSKANCVSTTSSSCTVDDTAVDQLSIKQNQISVAQAQLALEKAQAGPLDQDVKKAQADVAGAQAALDRATFDLRDKQAQLAAKKAELAYKQQVGESMAILGARADLEMAKIRLDQAIAGPRPEDVKAAQIALDQEKTKLDKLRDQPKVKTEDLDNARIAVQQAQTALSKTLADIDAGTIKGETNRATAVHSAQLALQQAQTNYDKLASSGVLPGDVLAQEQSVKLAELALQKAQTPRTDVDSARIAVSAAQAALDELLAGPSELELVAVRTQIQSLEIAVNNARQTVGVADAALAAAQAKYTQATRGADDFTIQDLTNKIGLATTALDAAQIRLQNKIDTYAQAKTTSAFDQETLRRAITQAQLDVQNFEAQTGDVKVIAPFAGKITRLAARPGDTVQAFFPVLNVSGLEGLVIKADISEADLGRLSVGMPVDMTMDVYPKQTFHGKIDTLPEQTVGQVGQAPERSTRIVVDWPGPGAELGMLARVQITLQIKENVLMVPNGAVRTVGKRQFVEYMDGDIKRSRNVVLGIVTDQDTEIISGLTEGMVILAGQS